MNKDDLDQKIKIPQRDGKFDLEFLKSINARCRGTTGQQNLLTTFNLQACAEDEFVKKQFQEMRCEMPGLPRSTFLMVFSPDGSKVASTHGNHHIYVTDVRSGKHIKTLIGHPRTPWCVAFHPTSNQIIASGCLGGQVRIWDLSGGSEVWTAESQAVIASIAFHPDERLLVIATSNQLFFWDWSKPEPLMQVSTSSSKEKVRYVAFDKLGHKLITGITNSPQTRWERVRAPVPVPRPADRSASPYRRRITPRLITNLPVSTAPSLQCTTRPSTSREPLSSVPERERRITTCYRDLVQQYEVLVHRYLQIYRPPVMVDQGTDPMEPEDRNQNPTPSTSRGTETSTPAPSTSRIDDSPKPSSSGTQKKFKKSNAKNKSKKHVRVETTPDDSNYSALMQILSPPTDIPSTTMSDILASLSSSNPQVLQNETTSPPTTDNNEVDFRIRIQRSECDLSSIADHEERMLGRIMRDIERRALVDDIPVLNSPLEQQDREAAVCRYLNLVRRGDTEVMRERLSQNVTRVTMTRRFLVPMSSTTNQTTQFNSTRRRRVLLPTIPDSPPPPPTTQSSSQSEPLRYRMKIKCSVNPKNNETVTTATSTTTTTTTTTTQSPESPPATSEDSVRPADNISDLLRNAELMLAKFRENLEQASGQLQNGTVTGPDIDGPSTSATFVLPPINPSKGTSTDSEAAPKTGRKRYLFRFPKSRRPVLDSSSDSSSDDEQNTKRSRAADGSSSSNEHAYASMDATSSAPSTSNAIAETDNNTIRIQINLSALNANRAIEPPIEEEEINLDEDPPLDFNHLLFLEGVLPTSNPETIPQPETAATPTMQSERICNTCGGCVDRNRRSDNNNTPSNCTMPNSCARTMLHTNTRTTNSTTYASSTSEMPRRRFLSHRLSAFHPTRLNQRSNIRPPRSPSSLQPLLRSRLGNLNDSPSRSPNFAPDEVINYAERVNEEENPRSFHPFDPPPELMSINPENIGIGNMYSNIVQELESSLNDVRNIRANRRLGETSDMLSSFSERLESIMTQSNVILRNLSTSLDSLPAGEAETASGGLTRVYRSLRAMDVRRNVFASNNPISDHTYPLNPENPQSTNMSPLMMSLQLTVSHIRRQARLLRQQVESIERIDRAMLEVAQLQMMRQMFDELHRHFSSITGNESRIGVSSVRQMMAGTRISDSSPYDSPSDDNAPPNNPPPEPQASTSSSTDPQPSTTTNRARSRKLYPRCIFLMHRQFRRSHSLGLGARRNPAKDRVSRRNIYRRFLPSRTSNRPNVDLSSNRGRGYLNLFNPDTLPSMTRRLEHFLMEHGRYIGRSMIPTTTTGSTTRSDVGEHIMMLRLNNCRQRINRILGLNEDTSNNEFASVTIDGSSRFGARQTLSSILDTLSRFLELNTHISSHYRPHIWEVIELSLLLSEILLLQIVDSIPPPSGMNLDPERESLSMRIDQMCSRMLQSRLSGSSHQLTRSLRLLRLTVRHATQALGQTYTARRNAMLPSNSDNERLDSRQGLLDDIHNCLRNIRRHRETSRSSRFDNVTNANGTREWYSTIHDLITRYINTQTSQETNTNSVLNNETGEELRHQPTVEDANSSDDNASTSNNTSASRERLSRPLYRTSNVNLLHNEESSPSGSRSRLWNVPTVQVNDVPVSEPPHSPWHPRFVANRQRLSERLDELRTTGGLFRPRFLHPLYAGVSPFEGDLDDPHREQLYDSDMIATVTPNHRIQVWEFSQGNIPSISNASKNIVVNECKIHNDASVDYASDGSILVTLLPSGGYMNVTNRLGVYSLEWGSLGQCLYITSFEQNAVSVSLSPLNRHLVVGLASRRVSIMPSDKWTMARIFLLDDKEAPYGKLSPIRELEQTRDTSYMSVNCIRWLPTSGQGLAFATNTGHLRFLT